MVISVATKMLVGDAVLSSIASAIKGLYGMVGTINDYLDDHIQKMKRSENQTISRTGDVLEGAKYGFGLGYVTSVIIIATGQVILGNTLSAAGTLATAVTLTNPIAMTCGAVGAIYYGWGALSQAEQAEIIEKLTKGLEVGAELIKSVLNFLISTLKNLLNSKDVAAFKKYIKEYASKFGKSLYEITHGVADFVMDTAEATTTAVGNAYDKATEGALIAAEATSSALKEAYETTSEAASSAADKTSTALREAFDTTTDAASSAGRATVIAVRKAYSKTTRAAGNMTSSTKKTPDLKEKNDLLNTEASVVGATTITAKVAIEKVEAVPRDAKTTLKVVSRLPAKSTETASKLAPPMKKTSARKVTAKVSTGSGKAPRRGVA